MSDNFRDLAYIDQKPSELTTITDGGERFVAVLEGVIQEFVDIVLVGSVGFLTG